MHPFFDQRQLRKLLDRLINESGMRHLTNQEVALDTAFRSVDPENAAYHAEEIGTAGQDRGANCACAERSPGTAVVWLMPTPGEIAFQENLLLSPRRNAAHAPENLINQLHAFKNRISTVP